MFRGFLTCSVVLISSEDVSVRYAVVFNGETELGDDPESLEEPDTEREEDVNAPKLKHIIVKALKQEPSLPVDIETLSFEAGKKNWNKYSLQLNLSFSVLLKLYKCVNFPVTTVYPVAEHGISDAATQTHTEGSTPTQSFFPTVAVIEGSLEASTVKPETHTFVPFIPSILPEGTSAFTDETPLMSGVAEENTEGTAEGSSEIKTPDTKVETIAEQEEEAEPDMEEIPPTEPDDGGKAGPEEDVMDGKATS